LLYQKFGVGAGSPENYSDSGSHQPKISGYDRIWIHMTASYLAAISYYFKETSFDRLYG
jgi:hypothetical protein